MTAEREIRLNVCKKVAANEDGFYTKLAGMLRLSEAQLIEYLVKLDCDNLLGKQAEEKPVGLFGY